MTEGLKATPRSRMSRATLWRNGTKRDYWDEQSSRPKDVHIDQAKVAAHKIYGLFRCSLCLVPCGKGDCYDNAVVESFFATRECTLVMTHDWYTREEARHAIFRYIETWYHRKRRYSALGDVSPAEYEAQIPKAT